MSSPLANPSFRGLFAAQICSLLGVGLLTVALSLAAYKMGGPEAGGRLLGMLLALKMVAYVALAPLVESLFANVSRKRTMVLLDLGRMLLLLPMALIDNVWVVTALAFSFFVLAAGFTPIFQSTIPDVLPDEEEYSKALAWSRIAYTLESLLSPVAAAALLSVLSGDTLFYAASLAFSGSVLALLVTRFPPRLDAKRKEPFLKRARRGFWIYGNTPRLRGLFLLNLSLSLAMGWVLVNSVVYAGVRLGDAERYFPILMLFYGIGSALGAAVVPRLLHHINERDVMKTGAYGFAVVGTVFALLPPLPFLVLLLVWGVFGVTSSLVMTPGGLVITRSASQSDRASVFAAQFSLSHAGWLLAYPLAGWLATVISLEMALLVLSLFCAAVASVAVWVWPANDPLERAHSHPELPDDHPHLTQTPGSGAQHTHVHTYHIDDLHPAWARKLDCC